MARYKREIDLKSYRVYVTNALNNIPQGKYLTKNWLDLMTPVPDIDADEVVSDIIGRAGLTAI